MSNALDFGLQSPTFLWIKESGGYSNPIKTGVGRLRGIQVNNITDDKRSIIVYDDNVAAATILINEFVPSAGKYYNFGDVLFGNGLWIVFDGAIDCTVIYF